MTSPRYLAPIGLQLGPDGGRTGGVDCTGWAASRVVWQTTGGERQPTGRRIRLLTDEPVPDPRSPGLNLSQVHDVLWDTYRIWTSVHTGPRALTWDQYEERRRNGRLVVLQHGYAPIRDSRYGGSDTFGGGHALYEDRSQTLDSLAGPERRRVYQYQGPLVYPRHLIREAAAALVLAYVDGRPIHAGRDKVWCLVSEDTVPDYSVSIRPRLGRPFRRVRVFRIRDGRIYGFDVRTVTRPLEAPCSPPRGFRWPSRDNALRFLVKVDNPGGKLDGQYVHWHWSDPVAEVGTAGDAEGFVAQLDLDDPDEPEYDVRNDAVEDITE